MDTVKSLPATLVGWRELVKQISSVVYPCREAQCIQGEFEWPFVIFMAALFSSNYPLKLREPSLCFHWALDPVLAKAHLCA